MKSKCRECLKEYEELEEENFIMIENDVPMICYFCKENLYQPERSKREDDKWFGMKAEIKEDGLCYFEDGTIIDPSHPIIDAVL